MKKRTKLIALLALIFVASIGVGIYLYFSNYNSDWIYICIAVFGICLAVLLSLITTSAQNNKINLLEQKLDMWNSITYRVKKAGETAFNKIPLGIVVFNDSFKIEWANNYAKEMFNSDLVEREIVYLSSELQDQLDLHSAEFRITLYGKVFKCVHLLRDHVLYFSEITNEVRVNEKYRQRTLAIGILNLDNLDECMSLLDAQTKALQMSKLIGLLTEWASKYNVCLKGYSEERYLLIMDYNTLENIMNSKVSVINTVKQYCDKEELRITVSIGIACDDFSAVDLLDVATEQLNLALTRGGNQAIVKKDGDVLYFGAQGEAFERRTEPLIKSKTEELLSLISKYKNIYILAHKYMDTDAFGACIAASKLCDSVNKKSYIILDEDLVDTTVKKIYQSIEASYQSMLSMFIKPSEAASKIKDDSLLIIVDCQYTKLLLDDKVYKRSKNIAIIDHHRKNADAIENHKFAYIQPSASSSVELIIELLNYVDKKTYDISSIEATWMIMGIVVDTNNYMIHTTNRTFNVLSVLQSYGAEMAKVQRFLREDAESYKKKVSFLEKIEFYHDYGIVTCDNEIYERSFMAKVADNIITINNVKAGFCIGKYADDSISISARSLDEENVQVLMEKLGGGGHYTTAATQMHGVSIEEAKQRLKAVLDTNKDEGEETVMRIILIKDVKGKGKVNDVLDLPMGHANYLIKNKLAIEGSPENIRQLENSKEEAKEKEEKKVAEMKELKVKVEAMTVKVAVKVGANGKLFGSVSSKEIAEQFNKQNGIELDKRKIMLDKPIDALGTYTVPTQLYKGVNANVTVYVVEEGEK